MPPKANWKLWLDDQLDDPATPERHTPSGWIGARSTEEAKLLVFSNGVPWAMDLDHDLGEGDRTMDFLKWLTETHPAGPVPTTSVHSQNPVGAKNILSFVSSWRRSLDKEDDPRAVLSRLLKRDLGRIFTVDADEHDKMLVFMEEHRRIHAKDPKTAIGGRFTYEFSPTSIGIAVAIRCACGERCDVTKYEDW